MYIMKKLFLYILPLIVSCVSCIQDEPANAEADVVLCRIMNEQGQPDNNIKGDLFIGNDLITVFATPRINLKKLAPVFELTPGATIQPKSGTVRDFSEPQKYVVTSESGQWSKEYTVSIDTFRIPVKYGFEYYETPGKYNIFYEIVRKTDTIFKQYIWASGNPGYALTGVPKGPVDYPTVAVPGAGVGGSCALKLETKSTGPFGEGFKMPIAAGNLFIGSFDVNMATADPLGATLFGLTFDRKPLSMKGNYRYTPGEVFNQFVNNDRTQPYVKVPGMVDKGDIYAVLYESTADVPQLNGANVLNCKNIVALARVENVTKTEKVFQSFEVRFDYGAAGRLPFDPQKLRANKYNLAVVFSSSIDGAYFAGAVGSTLLIDDIEIVCEEIL